MTVDPAAVPAGTQLSGVLVALGRRRARHAHGARHHRRGRALRPHGHRDRLRRRADADATAGSGTPRPSWYDVVLRRRRDHAAPARGRLLGDVVHGRRAARPTPWRSRSSATPTSCSTAGATVAFDARAAKQVTVDVGERRPRAVVRRMDFRVDGFGGSAIMPVLGRRDVGAADDGRRRRVRLHDALAPAGADARARRRASEPLDIITAGRVDDARRRDQGRRGRRRQRQRRGVRRGRREGQGRGRDPLRRGLAAADGPRNAAAAGAALAHRRERRRRRAQRVGRLRRLRVRRRHRRRRDQRRRGARAARRDRAKKKVTITAVGDRVRRRDLYDIARYSRARSRPTSTTRRRTSRASTRRTTARRATWSASSGTTSCRARSTARATRCVRSAASSARSG